LNEQASVGGAAEEREAKPGVELGLLESTNEQPCRLPVLARCDHDRLDSLEQRGIARAGRDTQRVRKIGQTDEEHVDAVDGGDLVDGGQRRRRLDLDRADDLVVDVLELPGPQTPVP
jgi:hypothetical protein